ncbi:MULTISPECIES: NUDIX hydrolase [unclassified Streptomyces]|uniref:NUDIX hydrolase n=1 Tax=unclassified Streptomyces TaxID=2593676 RepID=UPI0033DE5C2F
MAHAGIDPASPPRRRIEAVVLVRNGYGDVLMVKPRYKQADDERGWQLPGGGVLSGETVAAAAVRALHEGTGIKRHVTHALMIDQVPAGEDGTSAEEYNVVVDGGTLTAEEAAAVALPESARSELSDVRWVAAADLDSVACPYQVKRVRAAARAFSFGMRLPLYQLGEPTVAS